MDPSPDLDGMTVRDLLSLLVRTVEEKPYAISLQETSGLIRHENRIREAIIERAQGAREHLRAVNGPRIPGQPRSAS